MYPIDSYGAVVAYAECAGEGALEYEAASYAAVVFCMRFVLIRSVAAVIGTVLYGIYSFLTRVVCCFARLSSARFEGSSWEGA